MVDRIQDKLRRLGELVKGKSTNSKHSRATGGITTREKDGGMSNLSPNQRDPITCGLNRSSQVLNDLPPEILFQVFEELIWHISGNSYKTTRVLSRVCRLWRHVALELQFCKLRVGSQKEVDTILDSIRASKWYRENGTAAIRDITIKMGPEWHIYDVSDLLRLCRSSLQNFYLEGEGWHRCPVIGDKPEVEGDFYFPQLENLKLGRLTSTEFISFLSYINPAKLLSLLLCDIVEFHGDDENREKIESLQFPRLRELESVVNIPSLSLLCQAAPSLETLVVHLNRSKLGELVDLLASDRVSKCFNMLKATIYMGDYDDATDNSPDIKALLDLIRERGWRKRIHLRSFRVACIYD